MNRPLVIYHGSCPDGFTAAWAARKALGPDCEFVPAGHGDEPPDVAGRDVYILDFSYGREAMRRILREAAGVVVLDHHKTAEAELVGILDEPMIRAVVVDAPPGSGRKCIRFDLEKAGCRLAWEHFFPDRPAPWFLEYVEDRDLWRWALPRSRPINAGLASLDRTFETWDFLETWGVGLVDRLHVEGSAILRYQDKLVDHICRKAVRVAFGPDAVLAANTPVLQSEVAGRLAMDGPFGATWSMRRDGRIGWSLRSRGEVDVSEIARRHGGGGHRNAAGFVEGAVFVGEKRKVQLVMDGEGAKVAVYLDGVLKPTRGYVDLDGVLLEALGHDVEYVQADDDWIASLGDEMKFPAALDQVVRRGAAGGAAS